MSNTIDERVASMKFDNRQFESGIKQSNDSIDKLNKSLKLENASKGFGDLDKAAKGVSFAGISAGVQALNDKFSTMGVAGMAAIANISNIAVNAGINLAKSLTIDPMKTGLQEYETQLNAVQTILANTQSKGTNITDVNAALAELNTYADKTIYNFTEMTRNIGTFTAAGVDLKTSTKDIKGIANLAALSGSNAQQASTAMYQLSQAVSTGTVRLMDWNSVVNAGMGGEVFQTALKNTARNQGIAVDSMIKKNGSFRESLQEGWLTADILNKTLEQFTGDLSVEQIKQKGYTQAQAEEIFKMGQTAKDAATKVKTFTQLQDTLKEAVQSGWAQTWQTIIGDFDQAKALWTHVSDVIGGMIGASSDLRNNLLKGWADLGGRQILIDTFAAAFDAVMDVVKALKEAFSELFPPMTAKDLINISNTLRDFAIGLRLSEDNLGKLKRTFKGVFAILDIGKNLFQVLGKGIGDLFSKIAPGGNSILTLTARLGDWLVKVDQLAYAYDIFGNGLVYVERVVGKIASVLKRFVDYIVGIGAAIAGADTSGVTGFIEKLKARFLPLTKLGDDISRIVTWIGDKVKIVAPFFVFIGGLIGKAVDAMGAKITDAMKNANFSGMKDAFNVATLAVIAGGIMKFIKSLTSVTDNAGGMLGSIKGIFSSLQGSLEQMQASLKAKTLMQIALAIAVMTASVIALSFVDGDKLTKALAAMSVMFAQLFGSMGIFEKLAGGKNFDSVVKVTGALILLAIAIDLLTISVVALSRLSVGELTKGLTALTVILTELALFLKFADLEKTTTGSAVSLILIGVALKVIASAIGDFAKFSVGEITKGLTTIGLVLTELALFLRVVNGGGDSRLVETGVSMVLIGAALLMLANALGTLGSMSWGNIAKGLVALGGALLLIAVATKVMATGLPGAAALLIASVGLLLIAQTLTVLGEMSWGGIAKATVALLGALAAIAIGLTLMVASLPGAIALGVVAVSLMLLIPVLLALNAMSWGEIGKSLLMLVSIFGAIALGGLLIAPFIPVLLLFGVAVALLGVGMLAAGAGMMAFAVGLTAISVIGTIGVTALVAIVSALAGLIPMILTQLALGVIQFAGVIATSGPVLIAAFTTLLMSLLVAIDTVVPKLIDTLTSILLRFLLSINIIGPVLIMVVTNLIVALLNAIVILVPAFVDAGMRLLIGIANGIANNIAALVKAGADIIVKFLQGIGDNVAKLVQAGADLIVKIVDGFAQGVTNNSERIRTSAQGLAFAIIDGMTGGLASKAKDLWAAATKVGNQAISAIKSAIDSNSPSKKSYALGAFTTEGFANGIVDNSDLAASAGSRIAKSAMDSLKEALKGMENSELSGIEYAPTIKPVLDLSDVKMGASGINGMLSGAGISVSGAYSAASTINQGSSGTNSAIPVSVPVGAGASITYNQYNNSPKALSRIEIYRQTQNQLSTIKGALKS